MSTSLSTNSSGTPNPAESNSQWHNHREISLSLSGLDLLWSQRHQEQEVYTTSGRAYQSRTCFTNTTGGNTKKQPLPPPASSNALHLPPVHTTAPQIHHHDYSNRLIASETYRGNAMNSKE